jgi:Flp pilus assembly protein TadD
VNSVGDLWFGDDELALAGRRLALASLGIGEADLASAGADALQGRADALERLGRQDEAEQTYRRLIGIAGRQAAIRVRAVHPGVR